MEIQLILMKMDFYYIFGRADDTLKIAGKIVGPAEIETIAVEHPKVKEIAVIGIPDEVKEQIQVAFVILKEEEEIKDMIITQYVPPKL